VILAHAPVPDRAALARFPARPLHPGRNFTKAIVSVVSTGEGPVVVKDFASRPWVIRALLGPWHLDREERAYGRLRDVDGVPRLVGRIDRQAIALEYLPGRTLAGLRPGDLPASFFDRLEALVAALHAAGVAHADLHRHDVLAGPDGRPWVVDFSTAIVAGLRPGPIRRRLFQQACRADRRSVAKLRHRLLPGSDAPLPARPWIYAAGARVRGWVRRFSRPREH
jgi:hypothetical protein